jgi:hypothetical protein
MKSRRASIDTKVKVYRSSIHMKGQYTAIHSNFTEAQLNVLDSTMLSMFRKLTHLSPNTATHILTTTYGGIRATLPSWDINKGKLNALKRLRQEHILSPGNIGATGLLLQLFQNGPDSSTLTNGSRVLSIDSTPLDETFKAFDNLWAGSLLRSLLENEMKLKLQGLCDSPPPILEILSLTQSPSAITLIGEADVHYFPELIQWSETLSTHTPADWILLISQRKRLNPRTNQRVEPSLVLKSIYCVLQNESYARFMTIPITAGQTLVLCTPQGFQLFNVDGINLINNRIEGSLWKGPPTIHPSQYPPFTLLEKATSSYACGIAWSDYLPLDSDTENSIIGRMICYDDIDDTQTPAIPLYFAVQFLPIGISLDTSSIRKPSCIPDWIRHSCKDIRHPYEAPVLLASDASHIKKPV